MLHGIDGFLVHLLIIVEDMIEDTMMEDMMEDEDEELFTIDSATRVAACDIAIGSHADLWLEPAADSAQST